MKYILVILILFSCTRRQNNISQLSAEISDTIRSMPAKIHALPLLFETAFINGTTVSQNYKAINLYGVMIGKIKISGGHIIAFDPGHIDEYGIPFTQAFPTGEFPVQLSIAKVDTEETIAFARIYFSEEPVERWEVALQEGQTPIPVGGKKSYGYSVDLGVGIFADAEAAKVLDKSNLTHFDAPLYKEMEKHYHHNWKYALYTFGIHNLAAFTSGLGDGTYSTYIGFDAKGNPCRLITDFGFADWQGGMK